MALQRYAIDLLVQKGFTPVIPPYMINRTSYEGVTDLGDFEKVMYKIDGDDALPDRNERAPDRRDVPG